MTEEQHPFRSVNIEGMTARAFFMTAHAGAQREYMTVKDAADVDKALGDPENQHHCPLCNYEYGTAAFVAHAPACIDKYAPRKRVWFPAGIKGVIQHFSEERPRRPGSGRFDAY